MASRGLRPALRNGGQPTVFQTFPIRSHSSRVKGAFWNSLSLLRRPSRLRRFGRQTQTVFLPYPLQERWPTDSLSDKAPTLLVSFCFKLPHSALIAPDAVSSDSTYMVALFDLNRRAVHVIPVNLHVASLSGTHSGVELILGTHLKPRHNMKNMEYLSEVFQQDMKAAENALSEEDFTNLNVISNRIMSNAALADNRRFALPGFFLKDISTLLGSLKARESPAPFSTPLALAKEYVKKLVKDSGSPNFNENELWANFAKFFDSVRTYAMVPFEENTYTKNVEFTRKVYEKLITNLSDKRTFLTEPKNQLLRGIANEMGRIYYAHGGDMFAHYADAIVTALVRCDDYAKFIGEDKEGYAKAADSIVLPYVNRAIEILKEPLNVGKVNDLLWDLIKEWRQLFLVYMEPRRTTITASYEAERGIPLPEETRKKLTSAITKALEGEQPKSKK